MGKIASDGPKWGQEDCFPTNPDLADILSRTDLNFESFYFFDFVEHKFPDIQVPNFQKSGLGRAWAWAGLGLGLGPGLGRGAPRLGRVGPLIVSGGPKRLETVSSSFGRADGGRADGC